MKVINMKGMMIIIGFVLMLPIVCADLNWDVDIITNETVNFNINIDSQGNVSITENNIENYYTTNNYEGGGTSRSEMYESLNNVFSNYLGFSSIHLLRYQDTFFDFLSMFEQRIYSNVDHNVMYKRDITIEIQRQAILELERRINGLSNSTYSSICIGAVKVMCEYNIVSVTCEDLDGSIYKWRRETYGGECHGVSIGNVS